MKKKTRLWWLTLLLALYTSACSDDDTLDVALREDVTAILEQTVAEGVTPGTVIHLTSADGDAFADAAGVRSLEDEAPIAVADQFRAGSILKTFVATAILQQMERGALSLEDALTEHVPEDVAARIPHAEDVTIRMLLSHRTGIADWVGDEVNVSVVTDPSHVFTLDEILTLVEVRDPVFAPGEGFSYSNTNYTLLGEILTRVAGRSWRAVVREDVIARAGLAQTLLPEPGDVECPSTCARGYLALEGEMLDLTDLDPSMAGAAGGHALVTTAPDLTRFLRKLLAGKLFAERSTLQTMLTFEPADEPESAMIGYGLGLSRHDVDGGVAYGHLGGTAGFQSFMLYAPSTDLYFAGTMNEMGDLGALLAPLVLRIAQP